MSVLRNYSKEGQNRGHLNSSFVQQCLEKFQKFSK